MRFPSTALARRSALSPLAVLLAASVALGGCDDGTLVKVSEGPDASAVRGPSDAGPHVGTDGGKDGSSPDGSTPDGSAPDGSTSDAAPDSGPLDTAPDAADAGPTDSDHDGVPDTSDCAPFDASAWQMLPYSYRDADGDGATVPAQGFICAGATLPAGYSSTASGDDCNDADPTVSVLAPFYTDTDGDGFGAGAPVSLCAIAPPFGYAATGDDCAPTDAKAWQLLSYTDRDADGDGYTRAATGQVCAGAALPAGYLTTANGDDCDDTNPKIFASVTYYADTDGDGVGAGSATTACTDGSIPAGTSFASTDCAPTDKTKWQTLAYSFVDRDGDGATVPASGSVCAGASLPPPYSATAQGNDCDDTNKLLTHWDVVWPDLDADGAGAGAYVFKCDGPTIPAGFSRYGDDENDKDPKVGPLAPEDVLDIVLR
jgi:hypothetical protein